MGGAKRNPSFSLLAAHVMGFASAQPILRVVLCPTAHPTLDSPNYLAVKTLGTDGWQRWNPLNTVHRHCPPKLGEQIESVQNWRPGEKMLGPDGIHGVQVWELRQGVPSPPPPPPGSNSPPLTHFSRQCSSAHWPPMQESQSTPSSSFFNFAG